MCETGNSETHGSSAASGELWQRPVELLQALIRFDTSNPPGHERACLAYVAGILKSAGLEPTFYARDPERPNLVVRLRGRGEAPPLLLYGHVDVVPARRRGLAAAAVLRRSRRRGGLGPRRTRHERRRRDAPRRAAAPQSTRHSRLPAT